MTTLSEALRLLRENGILDRTHTLIVEDVQVHMHPKLPEAPGSERTAEDRDEDTLFASSS